jgi:hypothetical protein
VLLAVLAVRVPPRRTPVPLKLADEAA